MAGQFERCPGWKNSTAPQCCIIRIFPVLFSVPFSKCHESINLSFAGSDFSGISLDGGGLFSIMADPTDRNLISVLAFADIEHQMAMIRHFEWRNTTLGFPLIFSFSDRVITPAANWFPYRRTDASLSGSLFWTTGQWNQQVLLGGGYVRWADYQPGIGAYQWDETASRFFANAGFGISYRRTTLLLRSISFLDSFQPRVDGAFLARTNTRFPMNFSFFGAYDSTGMDLHGVSRNYGGRLVGGYTLTEFTRPDGLRLNWLAGFEAAVDFFSVEIQRYLSHLYFNRFTTTLALRNQLYDSKGHVNAEGLEFDNLRLMQSLKLRLGTTISFYPIVNFPVVITPQIWAAWKFSNTITGQGNPFNWGINLTANLLF